MKVTARRSILIAPAFAAVAIALLITYAGITSGIEAPTTAHQGATMSIPF